MHEGYRTAHRPRRLLPRRKDAVRNRQEILRTAIEVFAVEGPWVPLAEIARRAGVGPATLYRHFSDRVVLASAVIEEQLAALERVVARYEEANAFDPAAFRLILRAVVANQVAVRPLVALLSRAAHDQRDLDRYRLRIVARLAGPFRRAQAAGYLRADLTTDDLVLVLAMLEAVLGRQVDTVDRAISIVLDGLFRPTRSA